MVRIGRRTAVILFSLCILLSSTASAAVKASDLIVDTNFLKDKIGKPGWVMLDVRFADEYSEGHIPGAVLTPGWISKIYSDDTKRVPMVVPRLEKALGEIGISNESYIIVYGSRRNTHWNAVMFWVLETMGCNSSFSKCTVHFYDGGIEQWQAEGGNLEQAETKPKAATFKAVQGTKRGANADEIPQVVFPYQNGELISAKTLQTDFPKTWQYLLLHKEYLESREGGKMKGATWYAYTRSQALSSMNQQKIVTPDYYAHASYAFDEDGRYCLLWWWSGGLWNCSQTRLEFSIHSGIVEQQIA